MHSVITTRSHCEKLEIIKLGKKCNTWSIQQRSVCGYYWNATEQEAELSFGTAMQMQQRFTVSRTVELSCEGVSEVHCKNACAESTRGGATSAC